MSVQLLIDKETAQLNSRIEDLQNRLKTLQTELKKKKEEDACKTCEVDLMKKVGLSCICSNSKLVK